MNDQQRRFAAQELRKLADMLEKGEFSQCYISTATDLHSCDTPDQAYKYRAAGDTRVMVGLKLNRTPQFPEGLMSRFRGEIYPIKIPVWLLPIDFGPTSEEGELT